MPSWSGGSAPRHSRERVRGALASHQLEAFWAVAETKSFSRAAERLHVTQPALSQRIQGLEGDLERKLFVRGAGGVRLTEAGARLLRYCQTQRALEAEMLSDLAADEGEGLGGAMRIVGFSSVVRSCVVPALADVFRENARLSIELMVREMDEVADVFARGAAEMALIDRAIERPDVEHELVGHEELVLVESTQHRARDHVYLDHDPRDPTTLAFLRRGGKRATHVARSFFSDIYGILDGVAHGYGRAVVSRHLVAARTDVRIVRGHAPSRSAVYLCWFRQPSYTRAHDAVRTALAKGVSRALG